MEEQNNRKVIEMTIPEFLNFRKLAFKKKVKFDCAITQHCSYIVECEQDFMNLIGY